MKKQLFFGKTISSSFVLLSTDGVPNVPVKFENRPSGQTNKRGYLLLTGLNPFQNNKLEINSENLDPNMIVPKTKKKASPLPLSGAFVDFGLHYTRAAQMVLIDTHGKKLPLGTSLTLNQKQTSQVGFDGMAFFKNVQAQNHLVAHGAFGTCAVDFSVPITHTISQIGPLTCK